jgi:hypothetical protein
MGNPELQPAEAGPPTDEALSMNAMGSTPQALSKQEELAQFVQDPAGFIRQLIEEEAVKHLSRLKEEAELRGALNVFRRNNPDFARFEPMILQEVVSLIQNDPDGHIDPWDTLLEKAMKNFSQKFQAMLKDGGIKPEIENQQPPFVEGSGNRIPKELPPTFTREQIARMSLDEYLKNEAAIDAALRNQRIT